MGGKAKQKQYQYSKEGKFLREYESMVDAQKAYGLSRGNFYEGRGSRRMEDKTWICSERVGKQVVMKLEKIYNCPFCEPTLYKNQKPLEVYNLLGRKIAEFESLSAASKMTGISNATIHHRLNSTKNYLPKGESSLIFKYKTK